MFVVESGGDKVIQNNKQDEPTGEESPTRRKKLSKRQQFRDVNRQLKLQGLAYDAVRKVDGKHKKNQVQSSETETILQTNILP